MNNSTCLQTIRNNYHSLTATEKKVADYILQNSEKVIYMSISEFVQNASVVQSVIVRCCKSLGFKGYSDLKISLTMEISKNKKLNYNPYIYPTDSASDILDKIFTANVKTLHDTAERIDRTALQNVVDLLSNANMIYVYGIGTSSSIVNDFQYRIMQVGHTAFSFTDAPTMKISTLNIKKGDVAIGISHSGRTMVTIDALKLAKENGANTVCITSYPGSLITKECDYSLTVFSDEIQYPIEAVSARIAHMSVTDAIAIALSAKNYEGVVERSRLTHELVNTIRY